MIFPYKHLEESDEGECAPFIKFENINCYFFDIEYFFLFCGDQNIFMRFLAKN